MSGWCDYHMEPAPPHHCEHTDRRVHQTAYGWVAADDAGWTDEIYATEGDARAAVEPAAGRQEDQVNRDDDLVVPGMLVRHEVDVVLSALRAKVEALRKVNVAEARDYHASWCESAYDDVLALIDEVER